jgi:Fe-S-cluster-containing dehydrogenase component
MPAPATPAPPRPAVQYGFALDQRACIGCHACTVACKVEHGVELGVFRTWVKLIEQGDFPDVTRSFAVQRCNHCSDAPCVAICPVRALYRREDGIVDFDPQRCIGCKACLNACPYDALYIDPVTDTAAKCNFCAHRVDGGMKPACEVVCPTHAIVSGDLNDPTSEISELLKVVPSTVRAPEQGTSPNVFYLGADEAVLDPLAATSEGFLFSELPPTQREKLAPLADDARARTLYDVAHPPPWSWRVSSYFLSKGVAAGAMLLAAGGLLSGLLALACIALTGLLLVWDLKRPERVWMLFARPQWRSWLARGAQCINLAAAAALAYVLAEGIDPGGTAAEIARWAMVPAGLLLAGYTAFLFGQCEGRDLWQSRWLLPHTLVNALLAGAGALALLGADDLGAWLAAGALASAAIALLDAYGRHATAQAARAARNLRRDVYARRFGAGVGAVLLAAPLSALSPAAAGALALVGLWLYEDAWVRAGQSVPLS